LDSGTYGQVDGMTGHPSSPLVAAVGLVATAADGLRRLPHTLGSAGQAALRRYDELAVRGQHVLAGDPQNAVVPVPEAVPEPPIGRTAAVLLPDDVQEEVAQLTPGADLGHDELPLPDFDHHTVPQLRGRLRTLGLAELVQLRDYEQAHAARVPVLTLLDNRIAKLLADTEQ
jgi:hypothetical protein